MHWQKELQNIVAVTGDFTDWYNLSQLALKLQCFRYKRGLERLQTVLCNNFCRCVLKRIFESGCQTKISNYFWMYMIQTASVSVISFQETSLKIKLFTKKMHFVGNEKQCVGWITIQFLLHLERWIWICYLRGANCNYWLDVCFFSTKKKNQRTIFAVGEWCMPAEYFTLQIIAKNGPMIKQKKKIWKYSPVAGNLCPGTVIGITKKNSR